MTENRFRGVVLDSGRITRGWCPVEEFHAILPVLDAIAEHVDNSALARFALEAVQELSECRSFVCDVQSLKRLWLCFGEEGAELRKVDGVLAVIVSRLTAGPATPPDGAVVSPSLPAVGCRVSQGLPVSAVQIRRSRPRSVVSVLMWSSIKYPPSKRIRATH